MSRRLMVAVSVVALLAVFATTALAGGERTFIAQLSGLNEVPPRETPAQGLAVFHLDRDGDELHYRLIVTNLENPVMAHIHLGPVPGPVVVWLVPDGPPAPTSPLVAGEFNGMLAKGVITESDLVGQLAGMELDDLLALLRTGGAFVNVHTNDFVDPPNTGPGDFPGGEIAGTILPNAGFDNAMGADHGNH